MHYREKPIKNEIIGLLGSKIEEQSLKEVSKWAYYSIILDCTPDLNHVGLMTFVIRFVWCIIGAEPRMEEHFLESIPIEHSIGDSLIEKILVQLEETKNPHKNMLGQSYDDRAKKERNKSSSTILSGRCGIPRYFIANLQLLYILNLWLDNLKETCTQYNGQALKSNAVTLLELSLDKRTDASSKNLVLTLAKKVKSFKFVASLVISHTVLFKVYVISKMLQSENIDVSRAVEMIDKTRQAMVKMRSGKEFQQALVDARDLRNRIETETEFQEPEVRPLKKKEL
ncbi:hypothetical protein AVEN_245973-1 [Araneus ventricosus]|uniref:DUF4371 domain-containing protein n=1 Tax=Araneus ventricosus TaxID=182803 RepID=A0A4Y2VL89_ARAVE|nr:hypothetical protein AVEN_245973-1 [Araneus ventricosus]